VRSGPRETNRDGRHQHKLLFEAGKLTNDTTGRDSFRRQARMMSYWRRNNGRQRYQTVTRQKIMRSLDEGMRFVRQARRMLSIKTCKRERPLTHRA
jgi:hypothetical protein